MSIYHPTPSPTKSSSPVIFDEGSQPVESQYADLNDFETGSVSATLVEANVAHSPSSPTSSQEVPDGPCRGVAYRGKGKSRRPRLSALKGQSINKSILRPGGALDSQIGSQTWHDNEFGPSEFGPTASTSAAASSASLTLAPAPSAPSADTGIKTAPADDISVDAIMDIGLAKCASVVSIDPDDYIPPGHEYDTEITRGNQHFHQARVIYKTLLWQHQKLEAAHKACLQELEDLKINCAQVSHELEAAKAFKASIMEKMLEGWALGPGS